MSKRNDFFMEHLGITEDELWEDWENYRDDFYAREKAEAGRKAAKRVKPASDDDDGSSAQLGLL